MKAVKKAQHAVPPPLTDADVRAYQMYAAAQQRRPELAVVLHRSDEPAQPAVPA